MTTTASKAQSTEHNGFVITIKKPQIFQSTCYASFQKPGSWEAGITVNFEDEDEAIEAAKKLIDSYNETPPEPFDPERHGGYQPLWALAAEIREWKYSVEEYKALYRFWRCAKEPFIAEMCKRFDSKKLQTIATNCGSYSAKQSKKPENAAYAYQSLLLRAFYLNPNMFSYGMDGLLPALDRFVGSVTNETFEKYKESQAKTEAAGEVAKEEDKEAIANPKTHEDFVKCSRHYDGYFNMPEAFRAAWDDLRSTNRREEEAKQKSTIVGFSGGSTSTGATSIVKGWHQKHSRDTFTVTMENFLGDGKFDEALVLSKQLGGNYVNARVARMYRCTAGFQFYELTSAEKFLKALTGDSVDKAEELAEHKIERMENASERLVAMADLLAERAEASLNADRRTNTIRQAEMAASAQAHARSELAKANTMRRIAQGLAAGTIKHLSGIRNKAQIGTLHNRLNNAKYKFWQKHDNERYEQMRGREATPDDIVYVEYPYPRMWEDNLLEHLKTFAEEPGLKNLARDIKKSTYKSPYKKKIGKLEISGGQCLLANQIEHLSLSVLKIVGDRAVRVHACQDPALLRGKHQIAYTADGGKSWGVSVDVAVSNALFNGKVDLIDPPKQEMITISNPSTIADLQKAIKKLRHRKNPRLRRTFESLSMEMEEYNRLQGMDIKTTPELRAALREYLPLLVAQEKEDPIKAMERALIGTKIEGFFPTPRSIVDRMVAAADIEDGMSVLEPSAGKGDILDAIVESHPAAQPVAIELVSSLRDIILAKGHNLHDDRDFLAHAGLYDRIVMNPPFESRRDVAHVRHAFNCLNPGGRLVAIMSAGPFGGSSNADKEFQQWIDDVGAEVEELEDGSFNGSDSFRKTGVSTRMVIINKD